MSGRSARSFVKKFWKRLGPGFITGSSDDDPSGVGTYAASGAQFGFTHLWTAWFTIPLMIAVQETAARVGMVTGRGLVAAMRGRMSRPLLWAMVLLLLVANTINIGADIGAMADAARLLVPRVPFWAAIFGFTVLIVLCETLIPYRRYVHYLKWLTMTLLSYLAVAAFISIDWSEALRAFVMPSLAFSRDALLMVIAIFGTTISPYLIFWQTNEEVEDEVAAGRQTIARRRGATRSEMSAMRFDVIFGMIFSNVVMFFIIVTSASVLFAAGAPPIATAADAARILEPLAGQFAGVLFAFGVIGSGLLAVPILAGSASYALAELFHWREGFCHTWKQAHGFYLTIALATFAGICINFVGIPPMRALVWTAVVNGIVAPFSLYLLLRAGNDRALLGPHVNTRWQNIGVGGALIVMSTCVVMYAVLSF